MSAMSEDELASISGGKGLPPAPGGGSNKGGNPFDWGLTIPIKADDSGPN